MTRTLVTTLILLLAAFNPCHALDSQQADSIDYTSLETLLISPYKGKVISPFGYRGGRNHTGSDIKGNKGDTVVSACCGVVTMAKSYFGYGKLVVVKHVSNFETYYAHLDKMLVEVGDSVSAHQPLGLVGRTGRATTNHLHFEVRKDKKALNPEKYFDFSKGLALKSPVKGLEPSTELVLQISKTGKITLEATGVSALAANSHADSAKSSLELNSTDSAGTNPSNQPEYVVVQKGDTLYALAKRNGTTVKQLQELNQLTSNLLSIGQNLKLR